MVVNIDDPGPEIQAAAERHLRAVIETEEYLDEHPEAELCSPAVGPFCGCETCLVREVLAGAWPKIEEYMALRFSQPPLELTMLGLATDVRS